jgi:hypothetical protein
VDAYDQWKCDYKHKRKHTILWCRNIQVMQSTQLLPTGHAITTYSRISYFGHSAYIDPVWHSSASSVELFFGKQLQEQLHEQGRAMFLQLHHVLNSVRESFQRSWPESWAESWSLGY